MYNAVLFLRTSAAETLPDYASQTAVHKTIFRIFAEIEHFSHAKDKMLKPHPFPARFFRGMREHAKDMSQRADMAISYYLFEITI